MYSSLGSLFGPPELEESAQLAIERGAAEESDSGWIVQLYAQNEQGPLEAIDRPR